MSTARVRWISGPVLRAAADGRFSLRESILVGPQRLLGEVIRVQKDAAGGDEIVAQVYEDTTGLRPGVVVTGNGAPLSVRLGPHLLGQMFDGLLRPLAPDALHVTPGAQAASARRFAFTPAVAPGAALRGGQTIGHAIAADAAGARAQAVLLPPTLSGTAVDLAEGASFALDAPLLRLRDAAGTLHDVTLAHDWPVRLPRPATARLPADQPLVTGQRILDSLFPVALGGKAAIPGGFGTGKTVLLESLAKGCSADVIVYLGCGERGNELAGVLEEFPRLTDPRSGRPLMERTVIVANTSNMPVAAREASIYAAVTVAEYFRDQGLHVALMADSTSRWAEALREVAGRFGELPGEGGYPTYLASRLADFYERVARVTTLGGGTGSVTLLGSISPPSGDLSEPVTSHTKRYVRSFWALDPRRAQARFYPALNPLLSYSEDAAAVADWWQRIYHGVDTARSRAASGANEWIELRRRVLTLLDEQARLERMARIIGKDALPPRQRLLLACADLVNESFLRQSAFSPIDRSCSPLRQACMLRLLTHVIELAGRAVDAGAAPEAVLTGALIRPLTRMGEEIADPADPDDVAATQQMLARFAELQQRIEAAFEPWLAVAPAVTAAPEA